MKKGTLLAIVGAATVASGLLLKEGFWDKNRAALLVALSVIAAGTLVRLARGLPFNSADLYELSEIQELTEAVSAIMRKLRLLLVIIVSTMLLLVLAFPIVAFLAAYGGVQPPYLEIAASAILGAMHAYVFTRMYQVILGDEDLTRLQSKFVIRAVERKQGKKFTDERAQPRTVSSSSNYGKRID
jgi:hypothetical protein